MVNKALLLFCVVTSATRLISGRMIDLMCSAEVENVGRICVPADHTFFLKLTCTTCRSEFPNAVGVSSDMVVEGIKGWLLLFIRPPVLARVRGDPAIALPAGEGCEVCVMPTPAI